MQNNQDILHELDNWHQHYSKIQTHLHDKIQDLRTTIKNQNDNIHTLQQQIRDYESKEDYKTKFTQTQEHLHKEKERLEKLYHKYWETENECEKLRKEVTKWHDWFDQNRDVFDKVFTAAPQRTITYEKPPKKEKNDESKPAPKYEQEPETAYPDEPKQENTREIHLPKFPKFPKVPNRNTEPRRKRARPPAKRRIRLKR